MRKSMRGVVVAAIGLIGWRNGASAQNADYTIPGISAWTTAKT